MIVIIAYSHYESTMKLKYYGWEIHFKINKIETKLGYIVNSLKSFGLLNIFEIIFPRNLDGWGKIKHFRKSSWVAYFERLEKTKLMVSQQTIYPKYQ